MKGLDQVTEMEGTVARTERDDEGIGGRHVSAPQGIPTAQASESRAQDSRLGCRAAKAGEAAIGLLYGLNSAIDDGMSGGGSGIAQCAMGGVQTIINAAGGATLRKRKEVTIRQSEGSLDNPMPNLIESSREYIGGMNALALDVLKNPDKMKGFAHGNEIIGKKAALERLENCLKHFDFLTGNVQGENREQLLLVGKDIKTAAKILSRNLRKTRAKKIAHHTSTALSTAVTIVGCAASAGAALAPIIVKTAASVAASGCGTVASGLGRVKGGRVINQSEGVLEGSTEELGNRGINISSQNLSTLKACNDLALDVLKHPEKVRDFCFRDKLLGKKGAKHILKAALEKFPDLTNGVNDQRALGELGEVKKDLEAALRIVSKKLKTAKIKKGVGIAASTLALTAAIAGTVATFGCGSPITIPAAIATATSLLSATIGAAKTAVKIEQSIAKEIENLDASLPLAAEENPPSLT
jgi:hypothetical protein